MEKRTLGSSGLEVSAMGFGCMGMSDFYGPADEARNLDVLHHTLDLGVTFWDTADMYGMGRNEQLVGKALKGRRDQVVLATKFGFRRAPDGTPIGVSGRPEYVRSACDASLKRLGVDHIDLYYQHRVDPEVPIEDTVGAMVGLVQAGKILHLGLSEAAAADPAPRQGRPPHHRPAVGVLPVEPGHRGRDHPHLSRAGHRPRPLQPPRTRLLDRRHPLHRRPRRGRLAPTTTPASRARTSRRTSSSWTRVQEMASDKGCTPAQLALAWVLSRGHDVGAHPGHPQPSPSR